MYGSASTPELEFASDALVPPLCDFPKMRASEALSKKCSLRPKLDLLCALAPRNRLQLLLQQQGQIDDPAVSFR